MSKICALTESQKGKAAHASRTGFRSGFSRGARPDGERGAGRASRGAPGVFRTPCELRAPAGCAAHAPGARRGAVNWSRPFSEATAQDGGSPARTAAGPAPPALGRRPRKGPYAPQICQDRSRSAAP
ncbi:hypothetical protein GCM10010398_33230 [Streptomyces fimbriatus]